MKCEKVVTVINIDYNEKLVHYRTFSSQLSKFVLNLMSIFSRTEKVIAPHTYNHVITPVDLCCIQMINLIVLQISIIW